MPKRVMKNRLLELIQAQERQSSRRIKLKDLAEFVGVTNHTITSWIRNDVRKYEAHIVEGFCDYFNCDIADLFYLEIVVAEEITE